MAAPITGVGAMERLEDNLGAVGWQIDAELLAKLTAFSAPERVYPYQAFGQGDRPTR